MRNEYDCFVVFAEMRTGSNYLEASLNALDDVTCHGEAFNPHFMGSQGRTELLGVTMARREADPLALLGRIRDEPGLGGFRFFHDHDPRVLAQCLPDPRCAKIILTRNPLDSYVSLKIARETGQWRLGNLNNRKATRVAFDRAEFAEHLERVRGFQDRLLRGLQTTGQSAFHIGYDDLDDVEVLNGVARFLGVEARLDAPSGKLKRQNPEPVREKITNPEEMDAALAGMDPFGIARVPSFEPRRGPAVPTFVTARDAPLLFMPVPGGPDAAVRQWLAALDGASRDELQTAFTQKTLRQWKRRTPDHRSFTVLRHPVARAFEALTGHAMAPGQGRLRDTLRESFALDLPETGATELSDDALHDAFLGFLDVVRRTLSGSTSLPVAAAWATQSAHLHGFAQFATPDLVLREAALDEGLATLAHHCGTNAPAVPDSGAETRLACIYDARIEEAARRAYNRDYMEFGFGPWRP